MAGRRGIAIGVIAVGAAIGATSPAFAITGDFDADGRDDLVIGSPQETTDDDQNAGQVNVLYGDGDPADQRWDQDSADIEGVREDFDNFGKALAVGHFNCDGFDDLAIGNPGEEVGSGPFSAGAVNVLYGSASGLLALNDQILQQGTAPVGETAELSDQFGDELAAGDFNGDGCDELAIGVSFEGSETGIVHVLNGNVAGLQAGPILEQGSNGLPDTPESGDFFGIGLAAGNITGGPQDDLAVGSQSEPIPGGGSGSVHLIPGAPGGLAPASASFIHGDSTGIPGPADGAFGRVLAAGDVGRGPEDDVLIGVPFQQVKGKTAGAVVILFGGDGNGAKRYTQATKGVGESPETGDVFGITLAAGDVGKSGTGDAIIGAYADKLVSDEDEGVVHVLFGGGDGPKGKGSRLLHQNVKGIPSKPEGSDRFGQALAVGDFGKGARTDLAIGTDEAFGGIAGGAVHVLFHKPKGLSTNGDLFLRQGKAPFGAEELEDDAFGEALAP